MKYKITKQYAEDLEKLIAEFTNSEDATFFVERKLVADSEKNIKIIYRFFDDQQLIKEFNKEKINCIIRSADYAEGNYFLPDSFGPYKISNENNAANAYAGFIELNDAELFVEEKLIQSAAIKTFYIFNQDTKIAELNPHVKKKTESEGKGGQGKSQTISFNPTPFNMTPRPSGFPPTSLKDDKKDKH